MIEISTGQVINNQELMKIFGCSSQGGMRRAHKTNSLVLISNHIESIYNDRWINEIFYYTGMGTEGDQRIDFAQNKTLYQSNENKVNIYLFEVFTKKQYTFIGKVKLIANPIIELQIDKNGNVRNVYIFPLKLHNGKMPIINSNIILKNKIKKEKYLSKLDDKIINKIAKNGNQIPGKRCIITNQYERNLAVAEYAKRKAKGVCQLCNKVAPFMNKDGNPYLETHHIIWLSEGGNDTIDNVVALCPNCHRKMHIVNDIKDKSYLRSTLIPKP